MKGTGKHSLNKVNGNANDHPKRAKDSNEFDNPFIFEMSDALIEPKLKLSLKESWECNESVDVELKDNLITLTKYPFNCISVKNLLSDNSSIEYLVNELKSQRFVPKNNDLYKFVQSCELNGEENSALQGLRLFLLNQIRPWLQEVTGISLMNSIDMFCAKYNYSDYLLCHDDELMGK